MNTAQTPKYPIGHQDFKKIITEGFVYVDKTRYGEQALFDDLYISDQWTFQEYPVIRISFSDIGYRTKGLSKAIDDKLNEVSRDYDLVLTAGTQEIDTKFKELIHALAAKYQQQVVILIDEYDKPIIDYLDPEQLHQAKENRDILKSFYSVIKDADAYLKLFFITGVSKFSQVSIFSDLNNLYDLTLNAEYHEICGISQAELEQYFPQELQTYDKTQIKDWYNGYRWDETCETVYNPFSLLNFFANNGRYFNYWYTTGTPTFLMELSKQDRFYQFDNISASRLDLQTFDIERFNLVPLLFQTGYLTIKAGNPILDNLILSFPNREVREAYLQKLTAPLTAG
ncbi:unnamed protein product [Cyprideis torosa]|uniref:AAA-ATPase-like domain-containing protein n=1 Tax=Cyprideis torosa TaxID=163714 RepID=A0A7R8ZVN4_9CRUS|nr:unnamed protein product [Cyprideis torosa]CAG0903690.1 unnamed protein product [Cyprideis torosa]